MSLLRRSGDAALKDIGPANFLAHSMNTPGHEFQELVDVFSTRGNQIFEIEIIPSSLGSPILRDGCSIGITKKALVQAYTVARQLFIKRLMPMSEGDFGVSAWEKVEADVVADSVITEIMLLFDCEHLTACNWRKRRLLAAVAHCPRAAEILETELTLMATYQCSPLHRHTKSPTLWSHRLWVLRQLLRIQPKGREDLLTLERSELDIVFRAGELHPKNYYAFNYMRHFHALLAGMLVDVDAQGRSEWTLSLARALLKPVLDWCLANPKDISGWVFGKYLLDNVPDVQLRADAISRVLRFARDVGWEGESLWTFIDLTARQYTLEGIIDDILCREPGLPVSGSQASDQYALRKWPWKIQFSKAKTYWEQRHIVR